VRTLGSDLAEAVRRIAVLEVDLLHRGGRETDPRQNGTEALMVERSEQVQGERLRGAVVQRPSMVQTAADQVGEDRSGLG
jgi:hypothetical protein